MLKSLCEAKKPEVKRRLSPGKKNPKKRPDSAKIIKKIPAYPIVVIIDSKFEKFTKEVSVSMLYIVSTPIGNLDDLSYRQAKTLVESDIILAEDTRSYQKLLNGITKIFGLKPRSDQKLISYYREKEFEKLPEVLRYLDGEKIVSLISEAGTPLIADPGWLLVKETIKRNIPYDSLPGPSSVINALVLSGFEAKKWIFLGFLPRKRNDLMKLFRSLLEISNIDKEIVFIAFESAQRINKSLAILSEINPGAELVIAREMTKKFQEVIRGVPKDLLKKTYKGELTLVFNLS